MDDALLERLQQLSDEGKDPRLHMLVILTMLVSNTHTLQSNCTACKGDPWLAGKTE